MIIDQSRVRELVARPSESLNVEIKRWLEPQQDVGAATIVKAAFAIRNRNGGFLVLGFDDKTLMPNQANCPADVRKSFHLDEIQGIISRYASEPFEIAIGFEPRGGIEHVVIAIPEGVRAPVVVKRDLIAAKTNLLSVGDVYFRTLNANGTPSTARARPEDWGTILDICFENREADIGRFLRRHLSGPAWTNVLKVLEAARTPPAPTLRTRTVDFLAEGQERFERSLAHRPLTAEEKHLLDALSWSVGLIIDPEKSDHPVADATFLASALSSNPNLTGWPVWIDSRAFINEETRPRVIENGWEALILSRAAGWSDHLDFWRIDPKGKFFLRRALQDDLVPQSVIPGAFLDPTLVSLRVAEAIAVGLSMAKALGWNPDAATLSFGFRWTKLKGRRLETWANRHLLLRTGGTAHDDQVETFVEAPLDTPAAAIAPIVDEATRRLFALFDGYRMPPATIENLVQRLLTRTLLS